MHLPEPRVEYGHEGFAVVFERELGGASRSRQVRRVGGVEVLSLQPEAERAGLGFAFGGQIGFGVAAEQALDVPVGFGVADEEDVCWHCDLSLEGQPA